MTISKELYPAEDDLPYEEELLRNPLSLRLWWRYLVALSAAPCANRVVIYERALKALPGSYKLWNAYLRERLDAIRCLSPTDRRQESVNNTFERALATMHKMPRIWTMYLNHLTGQRLLTRARRAFDRALCTLRVTQHDRIWGPYLALVSLPGVPSDSSLRVFRRYLMFNPSQIEEFIDFLLHRELFQEAAECLASVLKDETRHRLWLELCDLLTKRGGEISGLDVDAIIRGGIRKFAGEGGRLWTSLAEYYIRRGLDEKARDVFEEGMSTVVTVRDFGVVFDSYAQFEQSMLTLKMDCSDDDDEISGEGDDLRLDLRHSVKELKKKMLHGLWLHDKHDLDLRLERLDQLVERRPELANSVLLRQNPHNVEQWHRRVKLFEGSPAKQIITYTEAVRTVDKEKAVGKPHTLWIAFSKLYESHGDLANARLIFDHAVQVDYKTVDNLASVWCEWAEMELRNKNFKGALDLMRRATADPSLEIKQRVAAHGNEPVQMKLHKSLKLWILYVDLEESLGNLESTRAVYEKILNLRIATPQIIINYAMFLDVHKYFEDSFKVYERGVQIFKYPHVKDIWVTYLTNFVKRYGNAKLERARELLERAVAMAPADSVKPLYLEYAKLEEHYGLDKRVMKVYDQATKAVPVNEMLSVYEIYIARATDKFGVRGTREIYEKAIESGLPEKDVKTMCLRYAKLEESLGEVDRARAIYVFASTIVSDPQSDKDFSMKWSAFEVLHGNIDTFRDMLRIKKSNSPSSSQSHFILGKYQMQKDQTVNMEDKVNEVGTTKDKMDGSRKLGFVSAGVENHSGDASVNRDDIELPEESDSDEDKIEINQKDVPNAVFGGLTNKRKATEDGGDKGSYFGAGEDHDNIDSSLGALARIKKQRLCTTISTTKIIRTR